MTGSREYELPAGVGDTARTEKRNAQERVERAETGTQKTDAAVSRVDRAVASIRAMHENNHYREILISIMQGSHSRA